MKTNKFETDKQIWTQVMATVHYFREARAAFKLNKKEKSWHYQVTQGALSFSSRLGTVRGIIRKLAAVQEYIDTLITYMDGMAHDSPNYRRYVMSEPEAWKELLERRNKPLKYTFGPNQDGNG